MLVTDILKSCSHGNVAEAAVISIGGPFATKVRSSAAARGLSVGEFTSRNVREFSQHASERDWRGIASRMKGADLALLAGLEAVLQRMMAEDSALRSR